jgi:fumarylacetoacetate (FAA) hydrolase family protein
MTDPRVRAATVLPSAPGNPTLVGRVWEPGSGPRLVAITGEVLTDVTALGPTMAELMSHDDPWLRRPGPDVAAGRRPRRDRA